MNQALNLKAKVFIGIPSRNNSWWSDFGISLACMMVTTSNLSPDVEMLIDSTIGTGLAMNRIKLCKRAIEKGCTHILFLDDDMRIPMDTMIALLIADKDIVAANCARKEIPPRSTAKGFDDNCVWTREKSFGLEEVKSIGTGVMMIKTSLLEKLPQPWFCEDPVKEIGEDVYFCNLAREHGHKVFIHHDISKEVIHMGGFEFHHGLTDEWDK